MVVSQLGPRTAPSKFGNTKSLDVVALEATYPIKESFVLVSSQLNRTANSMEALFLVSPKL
jgi:hypothetical protein